MRNISKIDILLIIMIIDIIVFVNYYSLGQKLFELMFFMPIYISLFLYFKNIWGCAFKVKNEKILRRTLVSVLVFYFTFVLIVNIIAVISNDWYKIIYRGKYINYTIVGGIIFGLVVYPLIFKLKKCLKR